MPNYLIKPHKAVFSMHHIALQQPGEASSWNTGALNNICGGMVIWCGEVVMWCGDVGW